MYTTKALGWVPKPTHIPDDFSPRLINDWIPRLDEFLLYFEFCHYTKRKQGNYIITVNKGAASVISSVPISMQRWQCQIHNGTRESFT